jgi:hypothetical protein
MESGLNPHAVNLGAAGSRYPERRDEALRLVRQSLAAGGRPMAGCVQVHVAIHARHDPAWTLEPFRAADWAAAKLTRLANELGEGRPDWRAAVRRYNGAGPMADAYVCRLGGVLDTVNRPEALRRIREAGHGNARARVACEDHRRAGARMAMGHRHQMGPRLVEVAEAP